MDLLLYIFLLLPLAQAWTFRYTNTANDTTTLHAIRNLGCVKIDLAKGKEFSYDPEGSLPCLLLYPDAECLLSKEGGAWCHSSKDTARTDFYGVKVLVQGAATATASISTSIRASAPPTNSSTSSTTSSSSSGSSLSGGAIAGIVVGGVVGVALIIAAVFFFRRRQKQKATLANQPDAPQSPHGPNQQDAPKGPHGPNAAGDAEAEALTSSKGISEKTADSPPAGVGPAPGSQLSELAGQDPPMELPNNQVYELDAHN